MPDMTDVELVQKAVRSCESLIEDLKAILSTANPFVADIVFSQLDAANEMSRRLGKTASHLAQIERAHQEQSSS
ncbi:hypothetical protein [Pseudoduganella sp. R-34]|uniref:hypothetical protein n=1 Tax=Pseudoduganella sp. R-34 TaxID=3404062 RepID=UPI003CE9C75D